MLHHHQTFILADLRGADALSVGLAFADICCFDSSCLLRRLASRRSAAVMGVVRMSACT